MLDPSQADTPNVEFGSQKSDVSWRCFPGCASLLPIRRALSPRNYWTFSFMQTYSWDMMLVDISLDCVVSQRPLYGTLVGFLRTLSLLCPYSRRMMIVLRRSLYCVFLTSIIWPFRSIATTIFDRVYPGSKHFVRSGFWPNYVSQCCVCHFSLTEPKHLDSCSNFDKDEVTSRALSWHYVSSFLVLDPSQAHTPNVELGSPMKIWC